MAVNVISTCNALASKKTATKSFPRWQTKEKPKFKTVFIEKLTGKFLGENVLYSDPEDPLNITFPSMTILNKKGRPAETLGINVRSIPNVGLIEPYTKIEYPKDFDNNIFDNVSASLKFDRNTCEAQILKEIEPNEKGSRTEQNLVFKYSQEMGTLSAAVLPDTINTNKSIPASQNSPAREEGISYGIAACALTVTNGTFLIPDAKNTDYEKYLGRTNTTINEFNEELTTAKISGHNYPQTLWGLAMYIFVILNDNLYNLSYSAEKKAKAWSCSDLLFEMAQNNKEPVISESHTHPDLRTAEQKQQDNPQSQGTGKVYDFTRQKVEKHHTKLDLDRVKKIELPMLIISIRGKTVAPFEVLYKTAKNKDDVTVIAKSKKEFIDKLDILYYNYLLTKYF